MQSSFFARAIATSITLAICVYIISCCAHQKSKALQITIVNLNKKLDNIIINQRVSIIYAGITLSDSLPRRNYICFAKYKDRNLYPLGRYLYSNPYKMTSIAGEKRKLLIEDFKKSDKKIDSIMASYVENILIGADSAQLCEECYLYHKERFDFLIDSVRLAHQKFDTNANSMIGKL